MKLKLFITIAFSSFYTITFAQNYSNTLKVDKLIFHAGLNIGGVTPTSIPPEIRDIEGYKPIYPFTFGIEVPFFKVNNKWEIISGLHVKSNGMRAGAFVESYKGIINLENTPYQNISGYFTGSVKTTVHNWYLELPVNVRYVFNEKWKMLGGFSFSNAIYKSFEGGVANAYIRLGSPTAEKINIPNAKFESSDQIRSFDFGGQLGVEYQIDDIWNVRGLVDYGFTNNLNAPKENLPVFLHNIFMSVTVGYTLSFKK